MRRTATLHRPISTFTPAAVPSGALWSGQNHAKHVPPKAERRCE